LVHALVADVAVAVVPGPVPVVVQVAAAQRLLARRRAAPQVVVEAAGDLAAVGAGLADGAARLVAQAARHQEPAEAAGVDQGHDVGPAAAAAALRAVLHDDVVPPRRLDGDAPLLDVVAARLLDVDVLAGLGAPDGHQGVPVVRRGDR